MIGVAVYCDPHVCLSVCSSARSHISVTTNSDYNTVFCTWYCSTLCTSGFVDDVVFSHNGANGSENKNIVCFVLFAMWRHRGRSLPSTTAFYINSCIFEQY